MVALNARCIPLSLCIHALLLHSCNAFSSPARARLHPRRALSAVGGHRRCGRSLLSCWAMPPPILMQHEWVFYSSRAPPLNELSGCNKVQAMEVRIGVRGSRRRCVCMIQCSSVQHDAILCTANRIRCTRICLHSHGACKAEHRASGRQWRLAGLPGDLLLSRLPASPLRRVLPFAVGLCRKESSVSRQGKLLLPLLPPLSRCSFSPSLLIPPHGSPLECPLLSCRG